MNRSNWNVFGSRSIPESVCMEYVLIIYFLQSCVSCVSVCLAASLYAAEENIKILVNADALGYSRKQDYQHTFSILNAVSFAVLETYNYVYVAFRGEYQTKITGAYIYVELHSVANSKFRIVQIGSPNII